MEKLTHPREQTCEGRLENPGAPPGESPKEGGSDPSSSGKAEEVCSRSGTPRR
jgi:hypothetical protein